MNSDQLKRAAGERAAGLVEDGMRVGLGSGSTARAFVESLGKRVRDGLRISAVASSLPTATLARDLGIKLVEHDTPVDLAIDGADAIERDSLAAIKGLGGALVRERLIAQAARRFVLIADRSKLYDSLSDSQPEIPIPVEVLPFGWQLTRARLAALGEPQVRRDEQGKPFVSDNGNFILDVYRCDYTVTRDLAIHIKEISGVVDHGLFLDLASDAVIASPDGITLLQAARVG